MTQVNGMKNVIMQVTDFLKGAMVNLLFYYHILWLLKRNLAIILPLKSKLSGKFQRFNAIDGNIEMLKYSWISKNFNQMKNLKAFCEAQTASHLKEIIQPSQNKSFLRLWNKHFLTEIYRNIDTFAFQVLRKCSSWASFPVKMFFLTPTTYMFAGKFVKWVMFLVVLRKYIFSNAEWVELCKMSEVFWAKPYCKMSDPFS